MINDKKESYFKDLPDFLKPIIKEMCSRVGADHNKINFKESLWYNKYEWSITDQYSFRDWLINYIYNDKKTRYYFMVHPIKNKKHIAKAVGEFLFSYGWKIKDA